MYDSDILADYIVYINGLFKSIYVTVSALTMEENKKESTPPKTTSE